MEEHKEDLVEQAKERLLDPFEPVFPMPGMWHLTFGFIFALVSFVGSLIVLLGIVSLHPKYEIAIVASASLFTAVLMILATRGKKSAAAILLFCSLAPLVVVGVKVSSGENVDTLTMIFLAFSVGAFVLLLSTSCRALINVLSIRREKIKKMKKDGTYNRNIAIARERWRKRYG
jgi:hypothetical protein